MLLHLETEIPETLGAVMGKGGTLSAVWPCGRMIVNHTLTSRVSLANPA